MTTSPTRLYEPPTEQYDGPLDQIEEALVRALTNMILRERREEAAAERDLGGAYDQQDSAPPKVGA